MFQEDNAGTHTEKEYSTWMQTTFNELGWHIELQAPQGKFACDTPSTAFCISTVQVPIPTC